jgi:hypothetical protein
MDTARNKQVCMLIVVTVLMTSIGDNNGGRNAYTLIPMHVKAKLTNFRVCSPR